MGYGLLEDTVLSYETNVEMIKTTALTDEATDQVLIRYKTKMASLSLNDQIIKDFVEASSKGIMGYVVEETDTLPEVDVTFLKEHVIEEVDRQIAISLTENIDLDELITYVREVPEGESISKAVNAYITSTNLTIDENDISRVTSIFIDNKDMEPVALKAKISSELARQAVDTLNMKETLSLQQFFDDLMPKNPFTLLRQGFGLADKHFNFYLPFVIFMIILLMIVIEFKLSKTISWFILSLILAVIPLQVIRLLSFFIDKEFISVLDELKSYQTFMLDAIVSKLNVLTLVVGVIIIFLIIIKRYLKTYVDDRLDPLVKDKKWIFLGSRVGAFAMIILLCFLVGNKAKVETMDFVDDIRAIQPSDFDPIDFDEVLSNGLNVEFDF